MIKTQLLPLTLLSLFLLFTNTTLAQNPSFLNSGKNYTFDSRIMGEERTIIVHVPDSYEKNTNSYPVLYLTDAKAHMTHTIGTVDYFSKFRLMPEMIVVGIVHTNRNRELTPTPINKKDEGVLEGADRLLTFLQEEVKPMIHKKYRTLPYSVFSGTSYGGLFGIHAFLKKPEMFDAIIAISPSLYWDNKIILKEANTLFKKGKAKGNLYLTIANEQPVMTTPFYDFIAILKDNPTNEVGWSAKTFETETHNTTVLIGQYYAFKELFKAWNIPEGVPQNLTQLLHHYDAMSKQLRHEVLLPEDRANGYGNWLLYLNRLDEATELFKWNTVNYPASSNAFYKLGQAEEKARRFMEAKNNYEIALRLSEKHKPSTSQDISMNLNRVLQIINNTSK